MTSYVKSFGALLARSVNIVVLSKLLSSWVSTALILYSPSGSVSENWWLELIGWSFRKNFTLKSRSSYNEFSLINDVKSIESSLKSIGYYFVKVEPSLEYLDNHFYP